MKAATKQATRSQAQICEDNQQTIKYYLLASVVGTGLYVLLHLLLIQSNGWMAWIGFSASISLEAVALFLMVSSTRIGTGKKGKIVDAGVDLNDSHSFGEYYKDTIILCVIIQVLALISSYFLLLLLIFPGYVAYKLFGLYFSAQPAPEEDPMDEKRQRRRNKIVYKR